MAFMGALHAVMSSVNEQILIRAARLKLLERKEGLRIKGLE